MMRSLALSFVLLAATLWCPAAGKKSQNFLVSFHLEADQTDNPKFIVPVKLGSEHRQYFFKKIPEFTDKDIEWFYPFLSEDGVSYGAAFRMKEYAAVQLKAFTLTNQGKLLGLRCSDAQLQAIIVDRPIDDGIVVIWKGLQQRHLQEFQKRFPHSDNVARPTGPEFALPR